MLKKIIALAMLALCAAPLAGCDPAGQPSAEEKQKRATDQLQADAEAQVGMPRVTNFTEKRIANIIYELRDQPNLKTVTYVSDMNGHLHCLGHSVGFGLPYSTQITNPQKVGFTEPEVGVVALPQAEPNGLYSADTHATWVLLVGPDGKPSPTYVEQDITVSLVPLRNAEPC